MTTPTTIITEYIYDTYQFDIKTNLESGFILTEEINTELIKLLWNTSLNIVEVNGKTIFTSSEDLHILKQQNISIDAKYEIFTAVTSLTDSKNIICGLTAYLPTGIPADKATVNKMYFFIVELTKISDTEYKIEHLHTYNVNGGGAGKLLHWNDALGVYFNETNPDDNVMGLDGHGDTVKFNIPYKSFFLEGIHENVTNLSPQQPTPFGVLNFGVSFYK